MESTPTLRPPPLSSTVPRFHFHQVPLCESLIRGGFFGASGEGGDGLSEQELITTLAASFWHVKSQCNMLINCTPQRSDLVERLQIANGSFCLACHQGRLSAEWLNYLLDEFVQIRETLRE